MVASHHPFTNCCILPLAKSVPARRRIGQDENSWNVTKEVHGIPWRIRPRLCRIVDTVTAVRHQVVHHGFPRKQRSIRSGDVSNYALFTLMTVLCSARAAE